MHFFKWIISAIILCCASILLFAANIFPTPYAASYSDVLFSVIWAGSSILLLITFIIRRKIEGVSRLIIGLAGFVSLVAMLLMLKQAVEFSSWKKIVLSTDSDLLQTLGQHFIIGYRNEEEIRQLVQSVASISQHSIFMENRLSKLVDLLTTFNKFGNQRDSHS
jgi:hypothetical protein